MRILKARYSGIKDNVVYKIRPSELRAAMRGVARQVLAETFSTTAMMVR